MALLLALLLLASATAARIGSNSTSLFLNPGFTSDMVLQRAPAAAAIYGLVVPSAPGVTPIVTVTLTSSSSQPIIITARIDASVVKGAGTECDALCIKSDLCSSTGSASTCGAPSCSFGCIFSTRVSTYSACTALCNASQGCEFSLNGWQMGMCGGDTNDVCSNHDPSVKECEVGCGFAFNKTAPSVAWKALLPPQPAGGNWDVKVACTSGCPAVDEGIALQLERVTFGDVFFCSGQSNAVLGLETTYGQFLAADAIRGGRYSNIRMWSGYAYPLGGDAPAFATTENDLSQVGSQWYNASAAVANNDMPCPQKGGCPFPPYHTWRSTSAFCFYFARALTDARGEGVPIGLLQSDMGVSSAS